jgi:actin-related protein
VNNVLSGELLGDFSRVDNREVRRGADHTEELWGRLLARMKVAAGEHAVLSVEEVGASRASREKTCQMLFEKGGVPAAFLARAPVLSCFSHGWSEGLVVDVGASGTSVSVVHEGFVLTKATIQSPFGGEAAGAALASALASRGAVLRPRYEVAARADPAAGAEPRYREFPGTHPSMRAHFLAQVVREIKETACSVAPERGAAAPEEARYELPDGTVLELGPLATAVPEVFFVPETLASLGLGPGAPAAPAMGLGAMVHQAISGADPDMRKDLYGKIAVTGGTGGLRGFSDRLLKEIKLLSPDAMHSRIKVHPSHHQGGANALFSPHSATDLCHAAWVGGSILASLGTFQQLWVTKAQYDEQGFTAIERKCF